MNSSEIKNIIDSLNKPEHIKIYYDINKMSGNYGFKDKWSFLKNKYKVKDSDLIAWLYPDKIFDLTNVFFLSDSVIIEKNKSSWNIPYEKIIVAEKMDVFHNCKFHDEDYYICSRDTCYYISEKEKAGVFACPIINRIIEENNKLYDMDKKIKYYLDLYDELTDNNFLQSEIINISKMFIYKKVTRLTKEPDIIRNLVKDYGYGEYCLKLNESYKKLKLKFAKRFPLYLAESYTIVLLKKAFRQTDSFYKEQYEKILSDCLPYLKLMQDCDLYDGYSNYTNLFCAILVYAIYAQKKISGELVYDFNTIIDELKNKLENGVIKIPQEDNLLYLSTIKQIGEIYLGIIIDDQSKVKKCSYLKNTSKAHYWLNLYINQNGADNTTDYEYVMLDLAEIYKYGTSDIPADEDKMLEYLKTAANHGNAKASKLVAEYYTTYNTEEKDKWIQLAKRNGQKVRDKRNLSEKLKEKTGLGLSDVTEFMDSSVGIFGSIKGISNSVRDTINTVKSIETDSITLEADKKEAENRVAAANIINEHEVLEHKQYMEGQEIKNKKAKAKNLKAERKADKKIKKEEKKRK